MNVLQNLTSFYNRLSPDNTYRNVCAGILEHLDEAAVGTIYDVAVLTNSSRTTIWRMVQKMGYDSFSDFHHELKRAVKQYRYYNRILPEEVCDSPESMKESLLFQMRGAYDNVEKHIDTRELEDIAQEMHEADRISFYTAYQSSSILSLQQNLAMSGIDTGYYSLVPEILDDCNLLTEDSLVFVNTIEHAETMDLGVVFERIRERGSKVIGFATNKSKYRKYVDKELIKDDDRQIIKTLVTFDMYFYLLSEIYRMKYI